MYLIKAISILELIKGIFFNIIIIANISKAF